MINSAIFWKTWRDSASTVIMTSIGMTAFVVLFVRSMMDMGTELMAFASRFAFLKKLIESAMGFEVSGDLSINVLFAACFTHGIILMLSWAAIIATTSRVTVGEVDRGTADLLLTLPVSRHEIYTSTTCVWVLIAMLLATCPFFGVWIGASIFEVDETVEISRYIPPTLNFFFLLLAVGGISSMISSFVNRRGLAVAIVIGILFFSVLLNFVAPFIEQVKQVSFLGLLSYFKPPDDVRTGVWPIRQMITLFGIGALSWGVGLVVFCRKDIPSA